LLIGLYAFDFYRLDLFRLPISLGVIALLHHLIIHLLFKMKEERTPEHWSVHYRVPWIGLAPDSYYPLSKFKQLSIQLFWVPFLFVACMYPWVSLSTMIHLIIAHVWIVLPRLIMFHMFRKHTKDGLIKISAQETSCYTQ
jgi:hypothetical protein